MFEMVNLSGLEAKVTRVCLGTMTFGSQTDEATAARMVDYCLDRGVNFFDTANVYNQGRSEEILGRCLGTRRSRVVLASKVRGAMDDPVRYQGLSAQAMRRGVEESLARLGTDYLDVCYLHQPDYSVPIDETLETLESLRREGKIRSGGTSNYAAWQVCEMLWLCEKNGWQAPLPAQQMYNAVTRGIEREFTPFAQKHGLSLVCYNPLAGGLLTGKQSFEHGPAAGTRFDSNQQYLGRYWHRAYFDAVSKLMRVSADSGRTVLDIAFRWLLQRPEVTSVIVGASKFDHLEANLTAAGSAGLPADVLAACDDIWSEVKGPAPAYNR